MKEMETQICHLHISHKIHRQLIWKILNVLPVMEVASVILVQVEEKKEIIMAIYMIVTHVVVAGDVLFVKEKEN